MKIAVIGANGRARSKIIDELLDRGLDVTAIVRSDNKSAAKNFILKDIFALTSDDSKIFDVVIDCFGAWTKQSITTSKIFKTSQYLCDLLSGSDIRLIIIGGAGSLYVDENKTQLYKTKGFPAEYIPTAKAQADELAELRKRNDVKWTFVSPAADFRADGERTGKYILAGEEFTVNSKGESVISYADYAIALVDEAINGKNIQKRISVLGE